MLILRHYHELVMAGLPVASNEALSHEVLRKVIRLGYTIADGATAVLAVPSLGWGLLRGCQQGLGAVRAII